MPLDKMFSVKREDTKAIGGAVMNKSHTARISLLDSCIGVAS